MYRVIIQHFLNDLATLRQVSVETQTIVAAMREAAR